LVSTSHLFGRYIIEADAVDAVALIRRRGETLSFENMTKVRAAVVAQNFHPPSIRVGLLLQNDRT
jgi:hypothetical protein